MNYWIIIIVAFAMFAAACEDKPTVELDANDAGATVKEEDTPKAKEATEKAQPAEKAKEKAKAKEDTPKAKEKAAKPKADKPAKK